MSSGLIAVEISRSRAGAGQARRRCCDHVESGERARAGRRADRRCYPRASAARPAAHPAAVRPGRTDPAERGRRYPGERLADAGAGDDRPDQRCANHPESGTHRSRSDGLVRSVSGTYIIRFREVVALPLDVMAFGRSRSSLLRCGAAIHTAVWDAGYHGRSEALLVVYAQEGIRLALGARVLNWCFAGWKRRPMHMTGAYQGENVSGGDRGETDRDNCDRTATIVLLSLRCLSGYPLRMIPWPGTSPEGQ